MTDRGAEPIGKSEANHLNQVASRGRSLSSEMMLAMHDLKTAVEEADLTIVTACDRDYLWGVYLLTASLRRHGVRAPIHVLASGFSERERFLIQQFASTKLFVNTEKRALQTLKPEAILTSKSSRITWMDADCIVTGNVTPLLRIPEGTWSIRRRKDPENSSRYSGHYARGETVGIPKAVLEVWRKDVCESQEPALRTATVSNCFTLDRRYLPFVEKWRDQMNKVLSAQASLVDWSSIAYSMSDECVLNSLLCFAADAPKLADYTLDRDPDAKVLHFSGRPKPWERWSRKHMRYRYQVFSTLDWVAAQGYECPPLPLSFEMRNRLAAGGQAIIGDFFDGALRASSANWWRKRIKRWGKGAGKPTA